MSAERPCPFCWRETAAEADGLDPELLLLVVANNPWWPPESGICGGCASEFSAAFAEARARASLAAGCRSCRRRCGCAPTTGSPAAA